MATEGVDNINIPCQAVTAVKNTVVIQPADFVGLSAGATDGYYQPPQPAPF